MAQRDSARQEESIGTTLVLHGGFLTPNPWGGQSSQGGARGISGHGVWHFVSYPPPCPSQSKLPPPGPNTFWPGPMHPELGSERVAYPLPCWRRWQAWSHALTSA